MTGLNILIAGAGIGGLTAASNLLLAGHDVTVFEQAPALGEVGAGIQISANGMHVLRNIDVGAAVEAAGTLPGAYVFRLYDTGEEIQRFALSDEHQRLHGAPYVQIHRADFHEILAARARALKPDVVRLNHRVTGFAEDEHGVTLFFADGTSAKGDLLIGADGLKSVIRKQIAGDMPATYTGDSAWRIVLPAARLPKDHVERVMSVWMGPGGHVVTYYLRAGELVNFVGIVETQNISEESWTAKRPWEQLKADFAGWHPDLHTVIDAADRDNCYLWSLYVRPVVPVWCAKRTVILGDAAHPTLPYLAQGAVMAIEDGMVLTRALAQTKSIADALQLYQRNRLPRTKRIVEQSWANRKLFHMHDNEEIRRFFARRHQGEERNAWLYSYNPLTVPLA